MMRRTAIPIFSYMGADIPLLDCGKYYLEFTMHDAEVLVSELFEVGNNCCFPQLQWKNSEDTSNMLYSTGYVNSIYLRTHCEVEYEPILEREFTEQEKQLFAESSRVQDVLSLNVLPLYNYLIRALTVAAAHDEVYFVHKNGEFTLLESMNIDGIAALDENRCLFECTLKMRQKDVFSYHGCESEPIAPPTDQQLPEPPYAGCDTLPPCLPPINVQFTQQLDFSGGVDVTAIWTASPTAAGYRVYQDGVLVGALPLGSESFIFSGLNECQTYDLCIATVCNNAVYSSPESIKICQQITTMALLCGNPDSLGMTSITADNATFSYDLGGNTGGTHTVQWVAENDPLLWNSANVQTVVTGSNTVSLTGLLPDTTYLVRVRNNCPQLNCDTESDWQQIIFTTLSCPLDVDISITLGDCTNDEASVQINALNTTGSFTMELRDSGGNVVVSVTDAVILVNVPPDDYSVTITDQLCELRGTSFTVASGCNCEQVTGLSIADAQITDSSATVNWGVSANATSYTLQYRKVGDTTWTVVAGIGTNQYTITGLNACTQYEVIVIAVCDTETATKSDTANFVTTGCNPPCKNTPELVVSCADNHNCFLSTAQFIPTDNTTDWQIDYDLNNKVITDIVNAGGTVTNILVTTQGLFGSPTFDNTATGSQTFANSETWREVGALVEANINGNQVVFLNLFTIRHPGLYTHPSNDKHLACIDAGARQYTFSVTSDLSGVTSGVVSETIEALLGSTGTFVPGTNVASQVGVNITPINTDTLSMNISGSSFATAYFHPFITIVLGFSSALSPAQEAAINNAINNCTGDYLRFTFPAVDGSTPLAITYPVHPNNTLTVSTTSISWVIDINTFKGLDGYLEYLSELFRFVNEGDTNVNTIDTIECFEVEFTNSELAFRHTVEYSDGCQTDVVLHEISIKHITNICNNYEHYRDGVLVGGFSLGNPLP